MSLAAETADDALSLEGCVVHLGIQLVVGHDGSRTRLTTREAELLGYLVARPGQTVSRSELLEQVWGYAPSVVSRASDTTLTRLREKVERDPKNPVHLITDFGAGYRFAPLGGPAPVEPTEVEPAPRGRTLQLTGCEVDLSRRTAVRDGETTSLTTQDVGILELLLRANGALVGVDDLLREVWEVRDLSRRRMVHMAVARLRAKIESDPSNPDHLFTARGKGYRLEVPESRATPSRYNSLGASPSAAVRPADEAAPTGEVTLVHARLHEGDALRATHPEAWRRAVDWVDEVLQERVKASGGYVARSEAGQWRMGLEDPSEALTLCGQVQEALLALDWSGGPAAWRPVQRAGVVLFRGPALDMAVLRGTPDTVAEERTGRSDYAGPEVGQVQCLLAAARPGQIVVDPGTWEYAGADVGGLLAMAVTLAELPGALRDRTAVTATPTALLGRLGWWSDPRADWQALPVVEGRLIGRLSEHQAILSALERHRLVTLLGPGGMGKTRLALAVADAWEPAAWADLRGLRTGREVHEAVAAAIGVGLGEGSDPVRALALRFAEPALLVLDEAEGAPQEVGDLVEGLLREVSHLRVLVTSRLALRRAAEATVELGPLSEEDAAALLCDRMAKEVSPELALQITGPVEGVPLAVELAAARAKRLGAERVAERLATGLGVLGSARGSGPRPTLRATLDWSLDLLPEAERTAFATLGVLTAAAPVELVEALLDDDDVDPLERVEALAEHSLVRFDEGVVDLYAVVRDHAAGLLADHPDRAEVEGRLVAFCARYGEPRFVASLEQPGAAARRRELATLRPHLRAALALAEASGTDAEVGCLSLALCIDHFARGPAPQGVRVGRAALAREGLDEVVRAEIEMVLGGLLRVHRGVEAADMATAAADRLVALDHPRQLVAMRRSSQLLFMAHRQEEAWRVTRALLAAAEARGEEAVACLARSRLAAMDGDHEARLAALRRAAETADPALAPLSQDWLGRVLELTGDYEGARVAFQRALEGHMEVGEPAVAARLHLNLGSVANASGDLEAQRHHLREGARLARSVGNALDEGVAEVGLGSALARQGDADAGRRRVLRGVELLSNDVSPEALAYALMEQGVLALDRGEIEEAGRSLDAALRAAEAVGPHVHVCLWGARAEVEAHRDPAAARAALATGQEREARASQEARARFHGHAVMVALVLGDDTSGPLAQLEALAADEPAASTAALVLARATAAVESR
ncbi:MAG: winged helix-turn-helix domain-containing protein [Myxococcales bacterium]|nr:winged helix-turn-helix domain-containing protein [Myxococcales bacterium]